MYELKKFHYDTAQANSAPALAALLKVAPPSQILFGTDYPFRTAAEVIGGLTAQHFPAKDLRAIERDNALRLLPEYNLAKDFGQRNFDASGFCRLEYAVLHFLETRRGGRYESLLGLRVEHPDVGNSHRQVIVDANFHPAHAVLWREDLNADERRLGEYFFARFAHGHANVRDAEARGPNLNPDFGHYD